MRYNPGTVIFLRADLVYHGITSYAAKAVGPDADDIGRLCPGRLSLMFYLHKDALAEYAKFMRVKYEWDLSNREKNRLKLKRKAGQMDGDTDSDEDDE